MTGLTSAEVPPLEPDDHVTGEGRETIVYMDLGCPSCAAMWSGLREREWRLCFRHFPMASKTPALACAARRRRSGGAPGPVLGDVRLALRGAGEGR